jgi:hypothetical protein
MVLRKLSWTHWILLAAATAAASAPQRALGQAQNVVWTNAGTGNYNTGTNWSEGAPPDGTFEQQAVIVNGGTIEVNSAAASQPGNIRLGSAPGGTPAVGTGTLSILPGGNLSTVFFAAPSTATGTIAVGESTGTGTLLMTGGTLATPTTLSLGGANASTIRLSGNATLNVGTTATLGRDFRIRGPNVNFTAGNVTFQGGVGAYRAEITGAAHSQIKTPGTLTLAGALNVVFDGVTPALDQVWTLADATTITGNFANAAIGNDLTIPGTTPAALGSAYRLKNIAGGTNGRLLQLGYERFLVLRVNRDTGEITIRNPLGANVTQMTAYQVTSAIGSMLPGYKGISGAPAGDTGWQKATLNSATGLAEFKPTGVFNVSSNATSVSLGNGFNKNSTADDPIGANSEDLVFNYTTHGSSDIIRGQIEYIGTPFLNNVSLFVNPADGTATLKNDTANAITIDGYSIVSSTGALTSGGWTSLASRPGQYPNWQASPTSANLLAEQNPTAPMALTAGQSITLGTIGTFATDAAKAGLSLRYILGNEGTQRNGAVFFGAASVTLQGDFDSNGRVDGRDFLTWQRGGSPNPLSSGDLALWRANYGQGSATGASAAVPEPGTLALTGLAAAFAVVRRRRND